MNCIKNGVAPYTIRLNSMLLSFKNFDPDMYHYLIYFDESTASVLLD